MLTFSKTNVSVSVCLSKIVFFHKVSENNNYKNKSRSTELHTFLKHQNTKIFQEWAVKKIYNRVILLLLNVFDSLNM